MQYLLTLLGFFLITTFVRLPFFFKDVISWDESTFILMGQAILDGHLPYTQLWDLKPPLAFGSHALFITIFGKSIVGIRFAGTLCVTTIAFCGYLIGGKLWNRQTGIITGVFSVLLISLLPNGQATMSEIIALAPLMLAFCLSTINQKATTKHFFIVGSLLATAVLVRLNLAYVSLAVGVFILVSYFWKKASWRLTLSHTISYVLGHFLIVFMTFAPYLYQGEALEWWRSVVLASLSYANSREPAFQALKAQVKNLLAVHDSSYFLIGVLTWITASIGIAYAMISWRKFTLLQRHAYILTWVFLVATAVSIAKGGATHSHYIIQLAPFVSLLSAIFLGNLINQRRLWGVILLAMAAAVIMTCYSLVGEEYGALLGRMINGQRLLLGPSYEVADYINQNRQPDESVYMMDRHIVYWFIDAEPLSKCSTHPSNITKSYLLPYCSDESQATAESEMNKILRQQPEFIVTMEEGSWYLKKEEAVWNLLNKALDEEYELAKAVDDLQIYRRKTDATSSTVLGF